MKTLINLLLVSLLLLGCKKTNPVIYKISVENESGQSAYLDIDGKKNHFTDKHFTQELKVEEDDDIRVSARVGNNDTEPIQMIFHIDEQYCKYP